MRITARHVRVCLGALWLLDGALQLQPFMYTRGFFTQIIGPSSSGQPAPISSSMTWAANLAQSHWAVFNSIFALIQVAIGVGIVLPKTAKTALAASFVWGVGVWWFGEGLGQVFTNASPLTGAPGAVILYVLIGALVWPTWRPQVSSAAGQGLFGELGGKLVWAVLWLGMAALWLTPANRSPNGVRDALNGTAGAGGGLGGAVDAAARAAAGRGTAIAVALAVASAAIGIGVFNRNRIPFLAAGITLSLTYWLFGQALGGITTGMATDPNAGPLFALLALTLMPTTRASRPAHAAEPTIIKRMPYGRHPA